MKNIHLIIICIVLFGTSTFFRKLTVDRIHPFQLQAIAGTLYIFLAPFWYYISNKIGSNTYPASAVGLALICNILYIGAAVTFGFVLRETQNTGVVTALVSLSPVITLSLSMLCFHEHFSVWKVIAFVLAMVSAVLINF